MTIYYLYVKTHKKTGLKYLGKTTSKYPHTYKGSGRYWKSHINKHGYDVDTVILKECKTNEELKYWGVHYSNLWNVVDAVDENNKKIWANLKLEEGDGGDVSSFIDYDAIDRTHYNMSGTKKWFNSLTEEERKLFHKNQGESRSKEWYVSRVGDTDETFVKNIAEWCRENKIDTAIPTRMNDPKSPMFQKQSKGWRIRRSDMPLLDSYIDKRTLIVSNKSTKGRTWKLIDNKRVWIDK